MAMKRLIQKTAAVGLGLILSVVVWAGLETGTYISDLVATNPLSSDLASTGDDHLRLIKSTIKTTFPNITGAVTSDHTELSLLDGLTGTVWTSANDGAASGLDADLLDGNSSAFFTSATNISAGTLADARLSSNVSLLSGSPTFTGGNVAASSVSPRLCLDETDAGVNGQKWFTVGIAGGWSLYTIDDAACTTTGATQVLTATTTGTVTVPSGGTLRVGTAGGSTLSVDGSTIRSAAFDRVARMKNTATGAACTVANDEGITGCSHSSTGTYSVDITAAGFSGEPVCVMSAPSPGKIVGGQAASATSATVFREDDAGTLEDGTWTLICMGQ